MLKAIIIDDEPKGRNILQQLIHVHFKEMVSVVSVAANADEGLQEIDLHQPDVVFLDVEMPGKSGFDLLREAGSIDFKIVFVTAYNHYSLKAIKFNTFDYLLKPVDLDELKQTIEKLNKSCAPASEKRVHNLVQQAAVQPAKNLSRIAISSVDSILLIDTDDILYFEALGSATAVYLPNKKIIASKTLKEFEDLLAEQFFFRIHHSFLINLQHVVKYIKGEGGSVLMDNQSELEVSRRKKAAFLEMLSAYAGR